MLVAKGFELDERRPAFGDKLPDSMEGHAGAVVFGGPMSANDPDEHIRREIDWMAVPLQEQAPLLCICLGAQMLVKQLGGAVRAKSDGVAEVGFYPLHSTGAGKELTDWPRVVYQWHSEGFELPSGATLLARGDVFENQAFSVNGSAIGMQFHSELTYAMACNWTVRAADRLNLPGAQSRPQHLAGWHRHDPAVRVWLWDFLDTWLVQDKREAPAKGMDVS